MRIVFFLFISFSSHTFFVGLRELCEPWKFSLFVHSLVCPITHILQPNLVHHSPHVCSTCHTVFSLKNTLECVCERLLHCRLIFAITWTPDKSQCILMYHSVVGVKKIVGLNFLKLSFKVASAYTYATIKYSDICSQKVVIC